MIALSLAGIALVSVLAQWLAWSLRVPAILFLLLTGLTLGPVSGLLDPDALLGDLLFPLVSLSVAIILFRGGADPPSGRAQGDRQGGAQSLLHRHAGQFRRHRQRRLLPAGAGLAGRHHARRCAGGNGPDGDRPHAQRDPPHPGGGPHPALGGDRHRPHRRPVCGAGVRGGASRQSGGSHQPYPAGAGQDSAGRLPDRGGGRLAHHPAHSQGLAAGQPAQVRRAGAGAGHLQPLQLAEPRIWPAGGDRVRHLARQSGGTGSGGGAGVQGRSRGHPYLQPVYPAGGPPRSGPALAARPHGAGAALRGAIRSSSALYSGLDLGLGSLLASSRPAELDRPARHSRGSGQRLVCHQPASGRDPRCRQAGAAGICSDHLYCGVAEPHLGTAGQPAQDAPERPQHLAHHRGQLGGAGHWQGAGGSGGAGATLRSRLGVSANRRG